MCTALFVFVQIVNVPLRRRKLCADEVLALVLGIGGGLRRVRARAGRQLRVGGRDGAAPRQGARGAGAGARRPPAASISTWPYSHSPASLEAGVSTIYILQYL